MDYPKGISADGAGLRIRIYGAGGRTIYSETLPCDPLSKKAVLAASKRRDWLVARHKLGLSLYDDEGDTSSRTLNSITKEYLKLKDGKPSYIDSIEKAIKRYFKPLLGMPVSMIRHQDIQLALKQHDIKNKTKQNVLDYLRGVLDYADVSPNPCEKVSFAREQKEKIFRYLPAERDRLLDKLEGQCRVYFTIFFATGMRTGEILALTWDDWNGECFHVNKAMARRKLTTTKTNVWRDVYVPTWARPTINEHFTRFRGGYILQQEENPGFPHLDARTLNKYWKKAHKELGLPYRRAYVCRHTRAAELLSTGVNPAEAAKQLGHSVQVFLDTYSEVIEEWTGHQDLSRFEGYRRDTAENLEKGEKTQ